MEGIDFSWARPGGAAIKNAGKKFVMRYLYADGEGGKGLDADETADYQKNGLEIGVVYESTAQRALDGYSAGVYDAQLAQAQLSPAGLPTGMPIYFAVDFDITDAQKPVMNTYLQGAASVIGVDRVGIYGGYYAVKAAHDAGTAKWFWQTYAWSGGQWQSYNHIEQYLNGQNINGAVDLCRSKQDNFGQASKFGGATPTPSPAPTPTSDVITLGSATAGYVNSADAAAGRNSNSTVSPGTYKITNRSNGMVNVVRMDGSGGWWINPSGAAPAPAPAPAAGGAQYAVVPGDTIGALAARWGTSIPAIINANRGKYPNIGSGSNALLVVGWVITNPASSAPSPASSAQYVTVQSGWGLSSIAQAAGYADAGSEGRWAAIAALNGSGDWRAYNATLKAGQSVRVR